MCGPRFPRLIRSDIVVFIDQSAVSVKYTRSPGGRERAKLHYDQYGAPEKKLNGKSSGGLDSVALLTTDYDDDFLSNVCAFFQPHTISLQFLLSACTEFHVNKR